MTGNQNERLNPSPDERVPRFPEDGHAPLPQNEKRDPISTNQQPQTAMEVHKHPHHVMHKKKFAEYLLEFFMLFLAVFLGFVAENIREHVVEKERAKQYIESFYEDLKTDTAGVADHIGKDDIKLARLSSLGDCYDTIASNATSTSCLLNAISASSVNFPFKHTDRTLNQLASAGGFRLLKREDADSIIAYQKELGDLDDFQNTAFQQAQDNVRNTYNMVVSFAANRQLTKTFTKEGYQQDMSSLLLTNDKVLLNKYLNELLLYYNITHTHRRFLKRLKERQERLVRFFKNKYGLEQMSS